LLLSTADHESAFHQEFKAMIDMSPFRIRLTSLVLVLAGLLFVLYPALRPFSTEVGMQGAAAFGSTAWIVAHSFAIVAFVLVVLGLFGLYLLLQRTAAERPALIGLVLSWLGVGLVLPFYGAEVFGLHAIAQQALKDDNGALISLASSVRGEPGIWFILTGLVLLGVGVIASAVAIWRSGILARWIGIPLAIGFALYIPQYTAPQYLRVAHGLLITLSCFLIAWNLVRLNAVGVVTGRRSATEGRPAF
jgi:hypothetical protein